MHLAITKQKFKIAYDCAASTFRRPADAPRRSGVPHAIVNYTISDGVATLEQWHNRTGHTYVQ
ncbi:uncharacterized protein PHALS_11334 [Plasmopara halstedii]|uniref:Uncharacterized protein n=1 Tax=Plasmopara halstedii TaxID=4781 RepID=A0A0P1AJM2_PLAHL|nr:uncharacterized protein PHALS_11334 [Plasmopara halstedii]CEG41172.1 hypothetical protein PHALS_11334 [Plasmopara halstedii]|eukprot:XP_024577541.1 hypothetical protein PHALS_11334 [Plasmopara halstedii]